MLRACAHRRKHALNELEWNLLMEQIAHRVDKNKSRLAPALWQFNQVFVQSELKAIVIPRIAHRLQPKRQALGVQRFLHLLAAHPLSQLHPQSIGW